SKKHPLGEKRNHPGSKLRQGFWMVFRLGVNNWGLKLQVYFALSYRNSLKLSLIGIFMSLAAVAKILLGTVLLVAIGYYMPALLFFVGIGMWHFFISDMLEPVYEIIHEKLATK
ncbi:YesL family protein, partial [Streptococcus pneumoniae]